jgi:hypothetical protein
MVLIYAGVVPTKPDVNIPDELRVRAKLLLCMLQKDRESTIILPAVAVAELLVPIPKAKHGEFLAQLQTHFVCAPFDAKAASVAANLFAEHMKFDRSEVKSTQVGKF